MKQMWAQKTGASIGTITAALARNRRAHSAGIRFRLLT
jgi:hypothetical protein